LAIILFILLDMGNECCGKEKEKVNGTFQVMEEFYDPLAEFKKLTITDPNILNKHAPKNTNFIQKLPMNLVKREMEYQQKSSSMLELDNDSFLLRNFISI
jgi:hypothetical protein